MVVFRGMKFRSVAGGREVFLFFFFLFFTRELVLGMEIFGLVLTQVRVIELPARKSRQERFCFAVIL